MRQRIQLEKALAAIKQGLVTGRWRPGEQVSVQRLAEELDMGITPVRDAVNELLVQGILERISPAGTTVARYSPGRMADLWELRVVLEGQAARWLAQRASDVAVATLTAEARAMDELIAVAMERGSGQPGDPEFDDLIPQLNDAEEQFHHHFVDYAGSPDLVLAWQPCHFLLLVALAGTRLLVAEWSLNETEARLHTTVMEAVASRDADRAEQTMREHVRNGKKALLSYLSSQSYPALGVEAQASEVELR